MIKANDLRVGNLVYTIDRTGRVHLPVEVMFRVRMIGVFDAELIRATDSFDATESWTVRFSDLSPIPLTEELILKMGFMESQWYFIHPDNPVISIDIEAGQPNRVFYKANFTGIEVEHIHSLQNAWKILTGEELTITNAEG